MHPSPPPQASQRLAKAYQRLVPASLRLAQASLKLAQASLKLAQAPLRIAQVSWTGLASQMPVRVVGQRRSDGRMDVHMDGT